MLDRANAMVGVSASFRDEGGLCARENEAAGFDDSGGIRTGTLCVWLAPCIQKVVGALPFPLTPSKVPSPSAEEGRVDSIGCLEGGGIGGGNFGGRGDELLTPVSASTALSSMSPSSGSLALGTMSERNSRSSEVSDKELC